MLIKKAPMGDYQTNCYIIDFIDFQFIIDSGVGSISWIEKEAKNPIAILLTHGHFDHIFDAEKISEKFNIPIYVHHGDETLLKSDPFGRFEGFKSLKNVKFVEGNIEVSGVEIFFHLFSGHTEGSCVIEIENSLFVGDLIFKGSIGRFDLPTSSREKMIESLKRFVETFSDNSPIYTGHGENTFLEAEHINLKNWIE